MRLGTQTASLVNHLQSRGVIGQPDPVVGMGATILGWTDRYPATIVEVSQVGKRVFVTVQEDSAVRTDSNGMSESQTYTFSPNPAARKVVYRQNDKGMWDEVRKNAETGKWNKVQGMGLRIGERDKYHDFSF